MGQEKVFHNTYVANIHVVNKQLFLLPLMYVCGNLVTTH